MKNSKNKISNNYKTILQIAIPVLIAGIVQQLEILINSAFLGRINSEYFSAVGNSFFPFLLCISIFWAINTGTTVLIAQNIGSGNKKNIRALAGASIKYNTILSLFFLLFWIFFSNEVFSFMGVKGRILSFSIEYIKTLSLVFIFTGASTTLESILHSYGKTMPLFISCFIKSIINVIISWLLVFGNMGFPRLEIKGAAIATVIAEAAGFLYICIYILKNKKKYDIDLKIILFSKIKYYWKMMNVGLPSGIELIFWNIGNLAIVSYLNKLGNIETGIYTLVMRVEVFAYFFYIGFAKAAQTLTGRFTGEKNFDKVKTYTYRCLKISIFLTLIFVLLFLSAAKPIISIFTPDNKMILKSYPFLMLTAIYILPKAINIVIGHGIRGLGDTKWMLSTQIFGTFFVVIFAYLTIFTLNFGLAGVYLTWIADEFIRSIINSYHFVKDKKFILSVSD